jgi:hypothetical protein
MPPTVLSAAVDAIEEFYDLRCAERSGVLLIHHIYEGLHVLRSLDASLETKAAFALHPMTQEPATRERTKDRVDEVLAPFPQGDEVKSLTLEYARVANASLSDIVSLDDDGNVVLTRPIELSPDERVNQMLVADKIQNCKDFHEHHLDHERANELGVYFSAWLNALDVSREFYRRMLMEVC